MKPLLMCLALVAVGCQDGGNAELGKTGTHLVSECQSITVPWGSGDLQAGFLPSGPERAAAGPPALAIAPNGDLLILDSRNARVLRVDSSGAIAQFIGNVVADAEDLAASSHGIAIHSPLRAVAWMYDLDGLEVGTIRVPRSFRHTTGLEVLPSRQLQIRSALQERHTLGSPAAPRALQTILASGQEGAFAAFGRGLSLQALSDRVDLLVSRPDSGGDRTQISQRILMADGASAGQLFGVSGNLACARIEQVDRSTETIAVERRASCVNVDSGQIEVDLALPRPGLYLPRHELALGGPSDAPKLAHMHAGNSGLEIKICEVHR